MRERPRSALYIADRENGLTYREIAEKYGVSFQAVAIACGKMEVCHFKGYTEKQVVYPNLRRWLNKNKVSRSEFARRIGRLPSGNTTNTISAWFTGKCYPTKKTIDKILHATGLTYEELFAEED